MIVYPKSIIGTRSLYLHRISAKPNIYRDHEIQIPTCKGQCEKKLTYSLVFDALFNKESVSFKFEIFVLVLLWGNYVYYI